MEFIFSDNRVLYKASPTWDIEEIKKNKKI